MCDPRRVFHGAKLMLFLGGDLLVLRRDHTPGITWPGYLDFPGGGREGTESPEQCVLRETHEEVGLRLREDELRFAHLRQAPASASWFFAAHLPAEARGRIVFGDEGAGWQLMSAAAFLKADKAIPHFRDILKAYLDSKKPDHRAK